MTTRMRLKRDDDTVYLDRWGIEFPGHKEGEPNRTRFGIFLHKMSAPDPGIDLHTHPWPFISFIAWGGYSETRSHLDEAQRRARTGEAQSAEFHAEFPESTHTLRGKVRHRRLFSVARTPLTHCHRIYRLRRTHSWSVVIHGRSRGYWTFATPFGEVESHEYGLSERGKSRGLVNDLAADRQVP